MITDDDILAPVRESLAELHMGTSVDDVIRSGRARRRRRREIVTAAVSATAVSAFLVGHAITDAGTDAPQTQAGRPPVVDAHPVAFTLTKAADGTAALKIYKGRYVDPDALRQAFAMHGIPALVTVGEFCRTSQEPVPVGDVLKTQDQPDGVMFSISPASIPPGAKLSVGYYSNYVRFGVIADSAPLSCTALPQPAAHASVSSGKIRTPAG